MAPPKSFAIWVPLAPDLPTNAESALARGDVCYWNRLVAPGRTPPDIINRLSETVQAIGKGPDGHAA